MDGGGSGGEPGADDNLGEAPVDVRGTVGAGFGLDDAAGFAFQAKTSLSDDNVFSRNEFVWGADGRGNAGLGLWQLAYASKETLDVSSYADARAAHQSFKGDNGKPLVIRSAELWVPPSLEQAALEVVQAERLANGASNVMRNLSKVVVCPWLTA